ncbi:MAG: PAS domain-containing protein [Bacilli bacterium]|nr:PAS domain-containing protein [Bacilli bacterium]
MKKTQTPLNPNLLSQAAFDSLREEISKDFSSFRNIVILAVDNNFQIQLYNKTFEEKVLEIYRIEINQNVTLEDIFTRESDYQTIITCFTKALKGKTFSNIQKLGIQVSRYYESFYTPLYDAQKGITGAVLFARDLSEISQDEATIQNAEEQLKKMASVLHLGLALEEIIYNDEGEPIDCIFRFINHQYEKFTGLKEQEVINKLVSQVIPDAQDGSFWLDKYKSAIISGETLSFDHYAPYIKKWFNIVAYCPMQHRLALLLTDISDRKTSENKIKQSEHLYRTIVNSLMAGVVSFDRNISIISMNQEAERIIGLNVEQFKETMKSKTMTFYDEYNHLMPLVETPPERVIRTKQPILNEIQGFINQSTKKMVWVNLSVVPIYDAKGELEQIISNFIDITDRKLMEDRIQEDKKALYIEKRQAQETLIAITEGVVSTDAMGVIKNFNKVAEEITEWSRQDAIGKHFNEIIQLVSQDGKAVESPVVWMLENQQHSLKKIHYILHSKNNHDYHIECSSAPILTTEGELLGVVVVFRNITDELALARNILMERQRLERVVEASTDILLEVNNDKVILNISGKGLEKLKITARDVVGKRISDIFVNSIDNHDYAYYQALLGNTYVYDWEHHVKDQIIWFESTLSAIYDENNQIIGVINIARETTERKQKQIEIEFLSTHDGLTQIHNRHYFVQKMETLDYPYHYPLGIFMADMNALKLVNDVFGHQVGDEALKIIAGILKQSFRQEDVVARIGGDEFAVILTNTTYERMVSRKALIQSRVSAACVENVPLSIALGFHMKTNIDQKLSDVVRAAETAMYEDKRLISRAYNQKLLSTFQTNLYHQYPQELLHAEKTKEYCKRLIECCNLCVEDCRQLELASQFHDIGKIFIPPSIYQKPNKLTMAEYKTVQNHVKQTHQMLKNTEEYEFVADIALNHHERWDGHGYPRGLKGNEIPPLSMALAIADAMAAMTRDRPYHHKMTENQALVELRKGSGSAYDPNMVALFIESFKNKKK